MLSLKDSRGEATNSELVVYVPRSESDGRWDLLPHVRGECLLGDTNSRTATKRALLFAVRQREKFLIRMVIACSYGGERQIVRE